MQIKDSIDLLKNNAEAMKRLFTVAGIMVAVVLLFTVGATGAVTLFNSFGNGGGGDFEPVPIVEDFNYENDEEIEEPPEEPDDGSLFRPPARTNFLLVGLDLNLLADAVMVGTFYRDTGNIHIMSIPRDQVVRIPQHRLDYMRAQGLRPPHTLKLCELRAYGGRIEGVYIFKAQIEEMLGVQFDYYLEVELAAFRRVVDAIGGVEMYIPRRLVYLDPTASPPTNINVPAGMVLLDGQMAEGVVRYRRWPMGDLTRNEMQMEFMSQLVRQAATRDALMNDPLELIRIVLEEANTNANISVIRYLPYVQNVGMDSVTSFELPGRIGVTIGTRPEFFVACEDVLPQLVRDVFFAEFNEPDESDEGERDNESDDESDE